MSTIEEVLMELHRLADPEVVTFKAKKYNVTADHSLGVYQKDLNAIAKVIGKNNDLALALYDTGIYEARILCSKLYQSKDLTEAQMECWVADFENWEICDAFCMKFFCGSPWVDEKLLAWTERAETFVKRAGFVMMATYSSTYKKAGNVNKLTFKQCFLFRKGFHLMKRNMLLTFSIRETQTITLYFNT